MIKIITLKDGYALLLEKAKKTDNEECVKKSEGRMYFHQFWVVEISLQDHSEELR